MQNEVYNSTVTGKIMLTPDLMILRVRTDDPREEFVAGQYTKIGALASEPRSANSVMPLENINPEQLIIRPYSIASAKHETKDFEFYISQVKSGQLTPRLFNLTQGRRMWVDDKILGVFNLNSVPDSCNIVMIATGTGLAPYISFLRSHIKEHTNSKLAIIHGAAYPWDLGYYSELKLLAHTFDNFFYFPTLLKADPSWTGLRGYIEKHLDNKILQESGIELNPKNTHFFLCGNPKMVESVTNYLEPFDYKISDDNEKCSIHIEQY